jgi:heme-degrading monooxygenase HmoA
MNQPSLLLLVKFRSQLSLDEVREVMHQRSDEFRALAGLIQKYYLQDALSGEYAGLYLWESESAFSDYRDSDLRASIAEVYRTVGEPRVEVFRVLEPLRE